MRLFRSILLPLAAVSVTFGILWTTHQPVPVVQSDLEQVRQEAQNGSYRLIDIDALRKLYQSNRDKIFLIDTRQEWEHRTGHIEGSANFPMETTWWARFYRRGDLKALLEPEKEEIRKSIIRTWLTRTDT